MPALVRASCDCNYPPLSYSATLNNIVPLWSFSVCDLFSQPLHMNAADEAYMLQRPSSLFWCHSVRSLSCLEISSVTLTPMSSPDSNLSAGLLTPPPAKPALLPPKPTEGCSIPRPRVNSFFFCLSAVCSVAAPEALVSPAFLFLFLLLFLLLHFKKTTAT